ncbi:TRAP transporter substrate-binding protein DctP [Myxococcota bacterium]|nr:TRAP transporter substrate-binding protein DctP [Myxococcota bacterium]
MRVKVSVFLLFLAVGMATLPAQARTLKIATLSPEGHDWMREMRKGADEIRERTDGRVKLKFYPGGVMGNDQTVLRKIRIGQLQGGAFSAGALVEVYNDMQVYSVPFLFRSYEEVDFVRSRMDEVIRAELENRGFVSVGFSEGGFAYLMSVDALSSREDLVGHKLWIPEGDELSQIALETAGISPVPLPVPDVYTGLQTGLIDVVASSPIGAIALQWHTRVKYLTDVPLLYLFGTVALSKKAFSKLSEADQAVVRDVMGGVLKKLDRQNRQSNEDARNALLNQGMQMVSPSPEEEAAWRSIAEQAKSAYQGRGLYSNETYETIQQQLEAFRANPVGALEP